MSRGWRAGIALAGVTLLFGAADARGAVTVGQTFAPTNSCPANNTIMQSISPSDLYTVPSAGVITAWSIQGGVNGGQLKFKVLRPATPAGSYTTVAESPITTVVPATLQTFPTRIPVLAGDRLGYAMTAVTGPSCFITGGAYEARSFFGDPPPGVTAAYFSLGAWHLDLAARLEADADGDGFGDETQDGCPTSAATQGPCPAVPPETTITSSPKAKSTKRRATFEFSSSVPGSTFECALDGKTFGCLSPLTEKVGFGKHTFQVTAKSPAGVADPTPATHSWKVKKKKKRK